ncbi:MAG: DUF366 family protein [Candidatus Gastranaerophilaceae bacterium]|jgi:hypothetical protein
MKSKFIEENITYTGFELSPHWIYKNFNIQGDAIVGFIGECDVKLSEMVDIADVIEQSPIYSKKMLHFIIEHFNTTLIEGVLRQRLLVNIAREVILSHMQNKIEIRRDGDDLFYEEGKLSVSIATKSITSVLIHLGINITAEGAPVKAAGLESEMNLKNSQEIAQNIIKNYCVECEQIFNATCKVRGVF